MRKLSLLFAVLITGCVSSWPPSADAQCKPAQGCFGASLTGTVDAVPIGEGTKFREELLPDCDDTSGAHLNYTTADGFTCGTSGSGDGVSSVSGTAPIAVAGTSTPVISITTDGIGADKIAAGAVGTSELKDGSDTPVAGECGKVDSDTSQLKYEKCGIGQPVIPTIFINGKPGADDRIWAHTFKVGITCPEDFAGSTFKAWEAAASVAEKRIEIKKNGTNVGDINFEVSAGDATPDCPASLCYWEAGDTIQIISEGAVNATLEDVELTFSCTRAQ